MVASVHHRTDGAKDEKKVGCWGLFSTKYRTIVTYLAIFGDGVSMDVAHLNRHSKTKPSPPLTVVEARKRWLELKDRSISQSDL